VGGCVAHSGGAAVSAAHLFHTQAARRLQQTFARLYYEYLAGTDRMHTILSCLVLLTLNYSLGGRGGGAVHSAQVLTPPNFNLAVGRKVDASSTCGVGVASPELFCKLTGANKDRRHDDSLGDFELIEGQLCDYCDPADGKTSHLPEYAVDGTERWWQSPPLSRGIQYNEVNLTINLGQVWLNL